MNVFKQLLVETVTRTTITFNRLVTLVNRIFHDNNFTECRQQALLKPY